MLYLSTRNKTDSFTAFRAMHNDNTPDGGLYVPFHVVPFTDDELTQIKALTFGDAVAKILNLFFSQQLTGWDVDFCVGKMPVKVEPVGHKAIVAELWHNHEGTYESTRNTLYSRLYSTSDSPSDWAKIAIDVAVLFGVHTLMADAEVFDLSIDENEYSMIAAAWYARNLGLPVGRILLTCKELSPVWDFVRYGRLNTTSVKRFNHDLPRLVERILFDTYGFEAAQEYLAAYAKGEMYLIDEELLNLLTERLDAVVVGTDRADNVILSTERTNGYILSCDAAAAFGGLQDYRSKGGESRLTLLLSGVRPANL